MSHSFRDSQIYNYSCFDHQWRIRRLIRSRVCPAVDKDFAYPGRDRGICGCPLCWRFLRALLGHRPLERERLRVEQKGENVNIHDRKFLE
jgi:hypothetical protein